MNHGNLRFKGYGAALLALTLALPLRPAQAYSAGQWESAEKIYEKVCSYCHDTLVAPPLFGRNLPADFIRLMVLQGSGPMPAFRPTDFSEEELKALGALLQMPRPARLERLHGALRGAAVAGREKP